MREYIKTVLSPRIQADGGWVEFVSLEGDSLTLLFRDGRVEAEVNRVKKS